MNRLLKYEMRKICSSCGYIAIGFIILLVVACFLVSFCASAYFYDENGNELSGIKAIEQKKSLSHGMAGSLTTEFLTSVIAHNAEIKKDKANLSEYGELTNEAYAKYWQPYHEIDVLLSNAFSPNGRYDYKLIETLTEQDANLFYEQYLTAVKTSISNQKLNLSDKEQNYLIAQAKNVSKPFYFDYTSGWENMLINWQTFLIFIVFLMCVFIAPTFSREYQTHTASAIFSSQYGRSRVFTKKVISAAMLSSVIYWISVFLYTLGTILIFGIEGWNASLQSVSFSSVYNLTMLQVYLIVVINGFLSFLLVMTMTLLISAIVKNNFWSIIVSAVLFFIPIFIPIGSNKTINKFIHLFPIKVMNGFSLFHEYNVYFIGEIAIPQHYFTMLTSTLTIVIMLYVVWLVNKRGRGEDID